MVHKGKTQGSEGWWAIYGSVIFEIDTPNVEQRTTVTFADSNDCIDIEKKLVAKAVPFTNPNKDTFLIDRDDNPLTYKSINNNGPSPEGQIHGGLSTHRIIRARFTSPEHPLALILEKTCDEHNIPWTYETDTPPNLYRRDHPLRVKKYR
jgi:hypothetical protein